MRAENKRSIETCKVNLKKSSPKVKDKDGKAKKIRGLGPGRFNIQVRAVRRKKI